MADQKRDWWGGTCFVCDQPAVSVGLYEDSGDESTTWAVCEHHLPLPCSHPASPHASYRDEMTADEYRRGVRWSS